MNLLDKTKFAISQFIKDNNFYDIVSIYGIGSIAKGKAKINDIDLNIFVDNCNYETIMKIELMKQFLIKNLKKDIDFNIIDMSIVRDGLLESEIFPHKNRHSLFLYELKILDCHIYGERLLDSVSFEQNDLKTECTKLTLTLVQRLNKEILTKQSSKTVVNGRKFCKYALEFLLISKGITNPYLLTSADLPLILKTVPEIENNKSMINDILNEIEIPLKDSYDFVWHLSLLMKSYYLTEKQ